MRITLARIHNGLAWLIFAGAIAQIFLISLAVFGAAGTSLHAANGGLVTLLALLMVIVAILIRSSRWNVALSFLVLLLLFPVQSLLAHGEFLPTAVRALHGLNGLLILSLSYILANGFARATAPAEQGVIQPAATD